MSVKTSLTKEGEREVSERIAMESEWYLEKTAQITTLHILTINIPASDDDDDGGIGGGWIEAREFIFAQGRNAKPKPKPTRPPRC